MPLSTADHVAILRHLQSELQGIDPELHALVVEHVERRQDPRRYLLDYLSVLARVMAERSAGAHGRVLNLLNSSVRTQDGGPIRGLRLELAPTERQVLQREYIDLATLPDRDDLVAALQSLHAEILRDNGDDRGQR